MNYIIENGLDFYAELKMQTDNNYSDNNCKLSYSPLDSNHISLKCGHKFNYIPLYNEVIQQKKHSFLETNRLQTHQIKCPYCRKKINNLLPFIPLSSIKKIHGVNYPRKYCMSFYSCSYLYAKGKKKGIACNKDALNDELGNFCNTHLKIVKKQNERKKIALTNIVTCEALIVNGKRKGEVCGCKIKVQNTTFCKRHAQKNILKIAPLV